MVPMICGYLVLSGVGVVSFVLLVRHFLVRQTEAALVSKEMMLRFLAESPAENVPKGFQEELEVGLFGHQGDDRFEFWREDGSVLLRSPSLRSDDLPRKTGALNEPVYWDLSLPDGRRASALGVKFRTTEGKTVNLVVASDRHEQDEALDRLRTIAWILGGLFLVSSWFIPRLLDRLLRPLTHLTERTSRVDVSSLSTRFELDALPAELASIAACLNSLFERLENAFERERRVSADLAHELRTPISELKIWAEMALRWPERNSVDAHRTTLAVANHLEAIVSVMLQLARSEQGAIAVQTTPIEFAEMLRETWSPFADRAAEKQIHVTHDLELLSGATDPALLKSILWNLFDNALEYTRPGGEISVRCLASGRHPAIEVSNQTEGVSRADLDRLFERFWRKDSARTEGRHVGLGLAIAVPAIPNSRGYG